MIRLLALLMLCVATLAPAKAQNAGSPEALAAAQDLAGIVNADTIAQLTHTITTQMWPRIEEQFGGKVDAATLTELRGEFETSLTKFTGEVMKDAPPAYAKYFSAQEIRDLLAFYRSPIGTKALKTMPLVTAEITSHMMPRMQAFQADLSARMKTVMDRHGYK